MQKGALMNSLVMCSFTGSDAPMEFICDLLESTTGERFSVPELRACANRGYILRYAFNLRAGYDPSQNHLPERIVKQLVKSDKRWVEEWPLVTAAYYKARGFDEQGYPTVGSLQEAGLKDLG